MAHYEVLDLESVYSKTGKLLYKRPTENLESKSEMNKCEGCPCEVHLRWGEGWFNGICKATGSYLNIYYHEKEKPFWCPFND